MAACINVNFLIQMTVLWLKGKENTRRIWSIRWPDCSHGSKKKLYLKFFSILGIIFFNCVWITCLQFTFMQQLNIVPLLLLLFCYYIWAPLIFLGAGHSHQRCPCICGAESGRGWQGQWGEEMFFLKQPPCSYFTWPLIKMPSPFMKDQEELSILY